MQKSSNLFPLNLQFFAEPGGDPVPPAQDPTPAATQVQTPQFDYQKLADLINGKQTVAEDTVLKNYFKQQGLSQEEATQAIAAFKEQKAKNQPDVQALQQQTTQAQQQAQQALIERDAYKLSAELGIDLKTMPYVLKLADMSAVIGGDVNIDQEKLKEALNKVLEDVPQLKPQTEVQQNGFRQIGVGNTQQTQQQTQTQQQAAQVPTKRWNRWNN